MLLLLLLLCLRVGIARLARPRRPLLSTRSGACTAVTSIIVVVIVVVVIVVVAVARRRSAAAPEVSAVVLHAIVLPRETRHAAIERAFVVLFASVDSHVARQVPRRCKRAIAVACVFLLSARVGGCTGRGGRRPRRGGRNGRGSRCGCRGRRLWCVYTGGGDRRCYGGRREDGRGCRDRALVVVLLRKGALWELS